MPPAAILLVVLTCLAASGTAAAIPAPAPPYFSSSARGLRMKRVEDHLEAEDGSCHLMAETTQVTPSDTIESMGILFAIQSNAADDVGLTITSLGLFLDHNRVTNGRTLEYEVYALKEEGHYATPERDATSMIDYTVPGAFDYRGEKNLAAWNLVSAGAVTKADLKLDMMIFDARVAAPQFFQIPVGLWNGTRARVPPRGGRRAFYVTTTTTSGLFFTDPRAADGGTALNAAMLLEPGAGLAVDATAPSLLVGEGISTYPMSDTTFFYQAKSFLGKVYYEKECASQAPSVSARPSAQPNAPSQAPSSQPSLAASGRPSPAPSGGPSAAPSTPPSALKIEVFAQSKMTFPLPCTPGEPLPPEKAAPVAAAAMVLVTEEAKVAPTRIDNVNVALQEALCTEGRRRRLVPESAIEGGGVDRRRLPSGSSAVDFSFVITGEYTPAISDCRRINPPCTEGFQRPPDLSLIVEDSINSDPERRKRFVSEIKKQAEKQGTADTFSDLKGDDMKITTVAVTDKADAFVMIESFPTKNPTPRPTSTPTSASARRAAAALAVTGCGLVVLLF